MRHTTDDHISLNDFWPYQVSVLADQVARFTISVVREVAELNQSQWRVLAAVADQPGCTAAEVTAMTPMDKTIVSRAVASLISSGHIGKTADHGDKRRAVLNATRLGLDCYRKVARRLNASLIEAFADLGSDAALLATLKDYVEKMTLLETHRSEQSRATQLRRKG